MNDPVLPVRALWVYLGTNPLLWLLLTVGAYVVALRIQRALGGSPWANPVLLSVAALVAILVGTRTPYERYFDGAQFVHFLLGPATVALAVPLYLQFDRLKRLALPLAGALLAGSLTAIISAVGIAWLLGAADTTLLSLAPKSVTAPIAMGIAEKIGGIPSLTAVLVIMTGVSGAMMAKYVLDALRITDHGARGFAVGIAAHGIGTARAFQVSEQAGAFAGLGMGLNGLTTAILMPLMLALLGLI